ncbi:hypothetical protein [Inquilinus sp.]|uniref:hypothetical protein n=1 Tax=Inquilinus sp. TaxID=1932117 RepID=UPI0031D5009D
MTWVASQLLGTAAGRWALGILLGIAAALVGYRLIRAAGAHDERAAQAAQASIDALNTLATKVKTDEALRHLTPAARRELLRQRAAARRP